ncbi:MAG: GNAT family N-acetyltransferase [Aeromicrobium sp.]|uniref:GNAT family N-acetyltransferase n=1 Tax=Aeromicrobium sp. TaxID=1871063 RepID=UPI0039E35EA0
MSEALTWPLSVPVLSDGTVTLRAHTPADVPDMTFMCQQPEASRYTTIPEHYTTQTAEDYISRVIPDGWDSGTGRVWAIEAPHEDDGPSRFAGNISLGRGRAPEIGFIAHPGARGRGIVTAAVRMVTNWAFTEGLAEAIGWKAVAGNTGSLRVAHACGFRLSAAVPDLLDHPTGLYDGWMGVLCFGDPPVPRTRWAEPAVLGGSGIALRPLRTDDVTRLVQAHADPEIRHWFADLPRHPTSDTARRVVEDSIWFAARGEQVTWAVADDQDRLVGWVSIADLARMQWTGGEVAYWTHPEARGHGVMRQAVRLVLDHALRPEADGGLGLRRISAAAAVGNAASLRVIEGAGFSPTGRQSLVEPLGDGTWSDLLEFELLR